MKVKILSTVAFLSLLLTIQTMCAVPGAMAQQKSADVSGTWFGDFVMTGPDGKSSHDTAVLILEQHGAQLTGSAGRAVDMQTPFSDGRVENDRVQFHLQAAGGMDFTMQLKDGHLQGVAASASPGAFHAEVNVQPAPELAPHPVLEREIIEADSKFFEAFDACDLKQYSAMLDENLEFYQDRTGKTDYAQNVKALENRCAEGIRLRRELVKDSLVVNPVPGYGVIEAGTQSFYAPQKDGSEHLEATAKFVEIWRKSETGWKLLRIISYDHR